MKRAQFIGGLILIGAVVLIFVTNWDVPVPVAITLLIVGIASIATSWRRR